MLQRELIGVAYVASVIIAEAYTIGRLRWNARRQCIGELDELVSFLGTIPATAVVVPLPWHVAFQLAPYVSCSFVAAMDASAWCRDYDSIFTSYPWIRPDAARWKSDYNASLVVVDCAALQADGTPPYDLSSLRPSFGNGAFQVFEWPVEVEGRRHVPEASVPGLAD